MVGGPNSWCFDKQGLARDGEDRYRLALLVGWLVLKPFGNCFLPGIGLVAGFLLRQDMVVFKLLIRPPLHTLSVQVDSLGEKLIPVPRQRIGVYNADFHRPEPTAAGFVA